MYIFVDQSLKIDSINNTSTKPFIFRQNIMGLTYV